MTYTSVLNDIQSKNYTAIPINISFQEYEQAAEAFLDFLTLPLETKNKFFFRIDEESPRTQVGYVRRHKDLGHVDNKEFFHYHALSQSRFKFFKEYNDERVHTFLCTADILFRKASSAFSDFLMILEGCAPGIHAQFFESHDFPSFFLRFLKYDVKDSGDFLARGHYDTGAMTLCLAESAQGLRIGKNDQDIIELPVRKAGEAIFMPALRCAKLARGLSLFTPAWHDVIQKSEDIYSDTIARWAIVFFADPEPVNRVSTDVAHTPQYR